MRILHIIRTVDPRAGGPIEGVLRQDQALGTRGSRELVSLDPPDAPFLSAISLKVHPLGQGTFRDRHPSSLRTYAFSPRLVAWLWENAVKYDAVIVNGLWNFSSLAASLVLPSRGVPYFVFPHGMLDPWFRNAYPVKHAIKKILWALFDGRLLSQARGVLFTSEDERVLARTTFRGYPYRAVVAPYGTFSPPGMALNQEALFREGSPMLGGREYLLFLGRIHPKKGCDLLIEAFARIAPKHPRLDLVIAGPEEGASAALLRDFVDRNALAGRVHWVGMLQGDRKWGAFRGARAFVLPSHQENFGIVVAEALACSTPVVISDKVNIWREIERAGAGVICSDNASSLEAALLKFLALPAGDIADMRSAALKCFADNFNMEVNGQKLDAIMRSLLVAPEHAPDRRGGLDLNEDGTVP